MPPGWTRKPVTISSKISAVSDCSVILRTSRRNSTGCEIGLAALHRLDQHGGEFMRVLPQKLQRSGEP